MTRLITAWEGDILHVSIDNPPVNALSQALRRSLQELFANPPGARGIVLSCTGRTFVAGADLSEFGSPPMAPHLPDVLRLIEACPIPVAAAIHGHALGGGLELALACHYRAAASDARLGLPEVSLGLVPGAGGTQRLPRLIAPIEAARMIATGKPIQAAKALALGLIDRIADDPVKAALALVAGAPADLERRRLSRSPPPQAPDMAAWEALAAEVRRSARGAAAPQEALRLVSIASAGAFDDGQAEERRTFLRLRESDESAALRHVAASERAAGKPKNVAGVDSRPIGRVGVVGAGTMGSGIALSLADAGLTVALVDMSGEALARALTRAEANYTKMVARGQLTAEDAEARRTRIVGSTEWASLADCDLVIEAAFESMSVKQAIFAELDLIAKPGAVLATNTSYLDIDGIAAATKRPEDVIGLHYFSPANLMPLLEIVQASATAPDVIATGLALAKQTGKVPVIARLGHGFIGNRLLRAYTREAGLLLIEGATPFQVDRAMTGFGMAMGPFAVSDLSGIDIGWRARQEMLPGSYEPLATWLHDRLVEQGDLGRKTGAGFYLYPADGKAVPNPSVERLLDRLRAEAGAAPAEIADATIVERCLLALANEGGRVLDEEIATSSGDIDLVYVHGYGFPRYAGGPMFWAERRGWRETLSAVEALANGPFGRWWTPSRFLRIQAEACHD